MGKKSSIKEPGNERQKLGRVHPHLSNLSRCFFSLAEANTQVYVEAKLPDSEKSLFKKGPLVVSLS